MIHGVHEDVTALALCSLDLSGKEGRTNDPSKSTQVWILHVYIQYNIHMGYYIRLVFFLLSLLLLLLLLVAIINISCSWYIDIHRSKLSEVRTVTLHWFQWQGLSGLLRPVQVENVHGKGPLALRCAGRSISCQDFWGIHHDFGMASGSKALASRGRCSSNRQPPEFRGLLFGSRLLQYQFIQKFLIFCWSRRSLWPIMFIVRPPLRTFCRYSPKNFQYLSGFVDQVPGNGVVRDFDPSPSQWSSGQTYPGCCLGKNPSEKYEFVNWDD